jgi:hypothetical protein
MRKPPFEKATVDSFKELASGANGLFLGFDGGSGMASVKIILTFAVACIWATPGAAQKVRSSIGALPSLTAPSRAGPAAVQRPNLAIPIVGYSSPDGASALPRGIIAGQQIAPVTVLGVGIFQRAPRMRGYVGGTPENMAPRKTKQAAIGLSMRF